jgi:hypothetical protein
VEGRRPPTSSRSRPRRWRGRRCAPPRVREGRRPTRRKAETRNPRSRSPVAPRGPP